MGGSASLSLDFSELFLDHRLVHGVGIVADAPVKLEDFLAYRLHCTASLVSNAFLRACTKRYGFGAVEWRILTILGQFDRITAKEICTYGHMEKTQVSRAVAVLNRRRLITRRPAPIDHRAELLAFTVRGRDIYEEIALRSQRFARQLVTAVDTADRRPLRRALDRFMAAALKVTIAPTSSNQEPRLERTS
jgi:DNA-binding MarR family transcriptional regulator